MFVQLIFGTLAKYLIIILVPENGNLEPITFQLATLDPTMKKCERPVAFEASDCPLFSSQK
jgi:hypothetical protein